MDQGYSAPYKSNYTIGIIITVLALIYIIGIFLMVILPPIAFVGILAGLISFILFLVWIYRSCKNLEAFNTQGVKYSPGWAVGSWFIPFINFVLPFLITMQLWQASDPDASTVSWKKSKVGVVVYLWWASFFIYLITTGIGFTSSAIAITQAELSISDPNIASMLMGATLPSMIGIAINSILEISVVVLINDRQDAKAEKLGLFE